MKKTIWSLVFLVCFVMVIFIPSFAGDTYEFPAAQVKFITPDNWIAENEEETLTIYPSAKDIAVIFSITDYEELDTAAEAQKGQLDEYNFDEGTKMEINGMPAILFQGQTEDGTEMMLGFVETPTGKILMMCGAATTEALTKYRAQINKIFTTMSPIE